MTSDVYYMDDRSFSVETSLVHKMLTLFDAAGFASMIRTHDVVAIKIHPGEYNNTGYLRPVYPRALADKVKSLGARPFVCETTTAPYWLHASRVTGLDLTLTAERNGFCAETLGCPFIVADGFGGNDDVRVDLPEGLILQEQYVARAVAMADVVLVLTHFKGHAGGVIGGAIKNIGIGCASQRGKHNAHLSGDPRYGANASYYYPHFCPGKSECGRWELCEDSCPYSLIHVSEHGVFIDMANCRGCYACQFCLAGCGVLSHPEDVHDATNAAIADSALACQKIVGRDRMGFINLAIDVTPGCDCVMFSDRPALPNLGLFASRDPVAIDQACLDMSNACAGLPGTSAEDAGVMACGQEKFTLMSAARMGSQSIQTNTGHLNGLGSKEYRLIEVPPGAFDDAIYHFDKRPIRQRMQRIYAKSPVYPPGGFAKRKDLDLEKVR